MDIRQIADQLVHKSNEELNELCELIKKEYGITPYISFEVDHLEYLKLRFRVKDLETALDNNSNTSSQCK